MTLDAQERALAVGRIRSAVGFLIAYTLFGVLHTAVMLAYCAYRERAGDPSDLPCLSWLWTPMLLIAWPLEVLSEVTVGGAVLVPSLLVRAVGWTFVSAFALTLTWLFRRRVELPPPSVTPKR